MNSVFYESDRPNGGGSATNRQKALETQSALALFGLDMPAPMEDTAPPPKKKDKQEKKKKKKGKSLKGHGKRKAKELDEDEENDEGDDDNASSEADESGESDPEYERSDDEGEEEEQASDDDEEEDSGKKKSKKKAKKSRGKKKGNKRAKHGGGGETAAAAKKPPSAVAEAAATSISSAYSAKVGGWQASDTSMQLRDLPMAAGGVSTLPKSSSAAPEEKKTSVPPILAAAAPVVAAPPPSALSQQLNGAPKSVASSESVEDGKAAKKSKTKRASPSDPAKAIKVFRIVGEDVLDENDQKRYTVVQRGKMPLPAGQYTSLEQVIKAIADCKVAFDKETAAEGKDAKKSDDEKQSSNSSSKRFNPTDLAWYVKDVRDKGFVQPKFLLIDGSDKLIGLLHKSHYTRVFGKAACAPKKSAKNFKRLDNGLSSAFNDYALLAQYFGDDCDYATTKLPDNAVEEFEKRVKEHKKAKRTADGGSKPKRKSKKDDENEEDEDGDHPMTPAKTPVAKPTTDVQSIDKIDSLFDQALQIHTLTTALLTNLARQNRSLFARLP